MLATRLSFVLMDDRCGPTSFVNDPAVVLDRIFFCLSVSYQVQQRIDFWASKIAHSKIGNPYQLARMFRKYDTEQGRHTSTVLLPEFVQVMMDGNLEVPRGLLPQISTHAGVCASKGLCERTHVCAYIQRPYTASSERTHTHTAHMYCAHTNSFCGFSSGARTAIL